MINEKSLEVVRDANFSKCFCRPLYSSYCFSQIPATIEGLFSQNPQNPMGLPENVFGDQAGSVDHVVLLFIDGFGWTFFEKYRNRLPFLQRMEKEGRVSKITSMFPSTTAAHVTCIHTGLDPSQSGLYEWFIYEPKLQDIIAPLPFSFAGDRAVGSLEKTDLSPQEIFPKETLYMRLQSLGVESFAFQPKAIANSPYSKTVLKGAQTEGYAHPREGLEKILGHLNHKTYAYFYYGEIDAIGHRKGIHSEEFAKAIEDIFSHIETFYQKLPPKTALLLTADHGMVEVSPKKTYYLNKNVPNIEKHLVFGRRNKPLAPAGSCRDFFLHVRKESLRELKEILSHFLEGRAEVYLTQELIENHFFGLHRSTENFLSRVGNLAILPYKGEAVWWYEKNRFQQNFYAAHGGLTREEMETIFITTRSQAR